jgi:hypothetical protein
VSPRLVWGVAREQQICIFQTIPGLCKSTPLAKFRAETKTKESIDMNTFKTLAVIFTSLLLSQTAGAAVCSEVTYQNGAISTVPQARTLRFAGVFAPFGIKSSVTIENEDGLTMVYRGMSHALFTTEAGAPEMISNGKAELFVASYHDPKTRKSDGLLISFYVDTLSPEVDFYCPHHSIFLRQ